MSNQVPAQYNDPYELHTSLMIFSSSLGEWFVGFVMERTSDTLAVRFYSRAGELKEKKLQVTSSCIKKVVS